MTDDNFLERLRDEAQQLRFEPGDIMTARLAARVRERLADENQSGVAQTLARWFRPMVASLAALALAAVIGVGWLEQSPEAAPAGIESMTSTQSVDIAVAGDVFSVE
ncbi:MAG: hypothetical protein QOC81_2510 [Thermoanaerobaculia bacterium]|jgi:hypothetical protein|nr:hypothetical protein [Thermoanaerobaculia bacterium]